jgi:hypothetical protein
MEFEMTLLICRDEIVWQEKWRRWNGSPPLRVIARWQGATHMLEIFQVGMTMKLRSKGSSGELLDPRPPILTKEEIDVCSDCAVVT